MCSPRQPNVADLVAAPGNGLRGSGMSRLLGSSKEQRSADGTLAVLIVVSALFCCIWAPIMLRRCRRNANDNEDEVDGDLARFESEARAVRAALQRMDQESSQREATMSAEFLDNRREFLDNALLTKKVIFKSESSVCNDEISGNVNDNEHAKDSNIEPASLTRKPPKRQKSNLVVLLKSKTKASATADESVDDQTIEDGDAEKETQEDPPPVEPCAICLADYEDGDEICWSHNDKCPHMFHRRCIQEWLLSHEECPCCRQDFLCLWGEGEDYEGRTTLMYSRGNANANTTAHNTIPTVNGNNNDNHHFDWATQLAAEIHQQLLLRNRQAQLPNPTVGGMPPSPQDGHNAVISVGDLHLAAGLLLYRHFPWLLQSDYDEGEHTPRPPARGVTGGGGGGVTGQIELPMNSLVRQQQQQQQQQQYFPNQLTSPVVVLDMNSVQQQRRGSGRRQRLRSYVLSNRDRLIRQGQEEAERDEAARVPRSDNEA